MAGKEKKRVTVYDIAKEAAISPSTVSRVLNNSLLVKDETRSKILRTAEELGFRKRRIRKQRRRAILNIFLFLPLLRSRQYHLFYDPVTLISSVENGFEDIRANIICGINGDTRYFDNKKFGDIDGCIFAFTDPDPRLLERIQEASIPFILLNRSHKRYSYIAGDNAAGMELLLRRMAEKKSPLKPCYLGFRPVAAVSAERREGFLRACRSHGIDDGREHCYELLSLADIDDGLIGRLQDKGYNGVCAFNDVIAVYFYQACMHRGIQVPRHFSLSGYDNSPVRMLLDKKIDTIELGSEILGFTAGEWLRRQIIDRRSDVMQKRLKGAYLKGESL